MRKALKALPPAVLFLLFQQPIVQAATYDGAVAYTASPRVQEFVSRLRHDPCVPWCTFSLSIERLCLVANNEKLRKIVWKRIIRESVFILARKQQKRIEQIACQCDMPLTEK